MVRPALGSGSWFAISTSLGQFLYTSISSFNGLYVDDYFSQPTSGSHTGAPNGSESPDIDNPWAFFGNTGMHQTTSPVAIISQSSNTALLDFNGWSMIWNAETIYLDRGAFGGTGDGVALLTCTIDCSNIGSLLEGPCPESWRLDYTATIQNGSFVGAQYELHLESGIVPLPAAIWLIIPGLLALAGMGRRKIRH